MKETNISKRIISFLLVLSMIFGTMTTLAFADGDWTTDTFNFDDPSVLIAGTNETNILPDLSMLIRQEQNMI